MWPHYYSMVKAVFRGSNPFRAIQYAAIVQWLVRMSDTHLIEVRILVAVPYTGKTVERFEKRLECGMCRPDAEVPRDE